MSCSKPDKTITMITIADPARGGARRGSEPAPGIVLFSDRSDPEAGRELLAYFRDEEIKAPRG